ncbi:MAG: leucine-rich repeat domain-containing protein [Clostridia bacterium]|nr:leucine-rich repeat domain-containing protein [Clostridia bacterium]
MKRKIILALTLMAVAICSLAISVSAVDINGIDYSFNGNEATVTSANQGCELSVVNIPQTVEYEGVTYTVTSIANSAFRNNKVVTSVETPSTIKSIGQHAFREMTALKTVVLRASEDFKRFSDAEFYQCKVLESIDMSGCVGLMGIGDGGTYDDTFVDCYKLSTVIFPKGVSYIGVRAFFNCTSLGDIENLDFTNVTYVGFKAFWGPKLTGDVVLSENTTYVGSHAFRETNITSIVMRMSSDSTQTTMDDATFYNCKQLKYVVLPNNITTIGQYTFSGCSALEYLIIGDSVTSISTTKVFDSCGSLKAIIYGGSQESFDAITNASVFGVSQRASFDEYTHGTLPSVKTLYYGAGLCSSCNGILGSEAFKLESLLSDMTVGQECLHCGVETVSEAYAPVFEDLGYSVSNINGYCSILQGFKVNYESIDVYNENVPTKLIGSFGVLATADNRVDNVAFDENGNAKEGVVSSEIKSGHNYFEIKLVNLPSDEMLDESTSYLDAFFHLCAYARVGDEIHYITENYAGTALGQAVSYNTIK